MKIKKLKLPIFLALLVVYGFMRFIDYLVYPDLKYSFWHFLIDCLGVFVLLFFTYKLSN